MSIGIAVITHARENQISQVLNSIKDCADFYVVVNDGTPYDPKVYPEHFHLIQHETPLSVGIAKNSGMKYLMEKGCEHIFTWEDDHILKDKSLFEKYISLSKTSGIKSFNYAYHGNANMLNEKPNPKFVVEYEDDLKLSINKHCVGAITYYHRSVIEKCGYHDEKLNHNSWEHVFYNYQLIKQGFHPPFWCFADLADSYKYVEEIGTVDTTSVIRKSPEWTENMKRDREYLVSKIGMDILQIPEVSNQFVYKWLEKKQKEIKTMAINNHSGSVCVVIPTLLKCPKDVFAYSLEQYESSVHVKKIIIIDNTEQKDFEKEYKVTSKMVILKDKGNQGACCNSGMNFCDSKYYLIVNDDVLCHQFVLNDCVNAMDFDQHIGLIQMNTHNHEPLSVYKKHYEQKKYIEPNFYTVPNPMQCMTGWFQFGRKSDWIDIPTELRYFYGDNLIVDNMKHKNLKVVRMMSSHVSHMMSSTVHSINVQNKMHDELQIYNNIKQTIFK